MSSEIRVYLKPNLTVIIVDSLNLGGAMMLSVSSVGQKSQKTTFYTASLLRRYGDSQLAVVVLRPVLLIGMCKSAALGCRNTVLH